MAGNNGCVVGPNQDTLDAYHIAVRRKNFVRQQVSSVLPEVEEIFCRLLERSLHTLGVEVQHKDLPADDGQETPATSPLAMVPIPEAAWMIPEPRNGGVALAEDGVAPEDKPPDIDMHALLRDIKDEMQSLRVGLKRQATRQASELEEDAASEEAKAALNKDDKAAKKHHSYLTMPRMNDFAELFNRCPRVYAFVQWATELQEPPRDGRLANIVASRKFESFCAIVICIHAIQTAQVANYNVEHPDGEPEGTMQLMERLFLLYYSLELILKICVHKFWFLWNQDMKWNIFDSILVLLSLWDQISASLNSDGGANVTFLRSIRLVKMVKIFRMLRVMRFFRELRTMLYSLAGSMVSFFWCFVMIGFILYMFSLVLVQGVATYLADHPEGDHEDLLREFGSMEDSMFSLYKATTGGNDWEYYYLLIEPIGRLPSMVFVVFTAFFTFAVFNVLTGIFVDHAMQASVPDKDDMIFEMRRKEWNDIEEVKQLCHQMDFDCSGSITWDEFQERLKDPAVKMYMLSLGLEVRDAQIFFETLRNISGTEEVDIDAFVEGCIKMKGTASGIDLAAVSFQAKLMQSSLNDLHVKLTDDREELDKKFSKVHALQKQLCRQVRGEMAGLGKAGSATHVQTDESVAPNSGRMTPQRSDIDFEGLDGLDADSIPRSDGSKGRLAAACSTRTRL